jgi:N-acetylglutamate synthase-like GNAT family acetyltransferase
VAISPQGSLIGCGQIKPHSDGSKELASIAVQEKVRGKGIARLIISTLIALEPERPLYLMCRARLNLFYDKFGFRPVILEDMPPYFKRISRVERIFNSSSRAEDRLLVMRLD